MAVLKIVQYPDDRLSRPGEKITQFDDALKKIVDDMFETHYQAEHCTALAATQLGLPYCITVIDFSEKNDSPLCLINPEIIKKEGTETSSEGCMSVMDIFQKVTRAAHITVRYQDIHGETHTMEASGFMAKCIQHEVDHLNGLLFLDRLTPIRRLLIQNKIKKISKK